jgi:hypothetical protein
VHSYHRTCAALGESCVGRARGGVTHVTVGTGGKRLSPVEQSDQPRWLESAEEAYGYGRVEVDGAASLRFEFVAAADGRVLDSVELEGPAADRGRCRGGESGALLRRPGRGAELHTPSASDS